MLTKFQLWSIAKFLPTFGPSTTETAQIMNTADLQTKLITKLSSIWALTTLTHQLCTNKHNTKTPQLGEFLNALTLNFLVSMEKPELLSINHLAQFATKTQPHHARFLAPVLLMTASTTWLPVQFNPLQPLPFLI